MSLQKPRLRYLPTLLKLLLIFLVAGAFVILWYVSTLPERADAQQTIVIGQNRLVPGSRAGLRVVVQAVDGQPLPDAEVQVSLQSVDGGPAVPLFDGQTGRDGSLPLDFAVPADAVGDYELIVETKSASGSDRVEQQVAIERDYRLLLSTDKPLYQPGQVIHMRALALSRFDLSPAQGATVDFLVEDAKANKVFRRSVPASEFGVAAVDFTLGDMVNQGNYKLSATLGNTTSERTVEVRPYVLPKFRVTVTTDRSFYIPGQRVEGTLQADYFFGKPVAGGKVELNGAIYDFERMVTVALSGETDENGSYRFAFDLPDYFAGSGLDSGQARYALEVTVIDQADHPEQVSRILPIAAQPIIIEAIPESGSLRPGVENIIYLLTAYPDGTPAQATLQVRMGGELATLSTGEYGLAEYRFTPGQGGDNGMQVVARDETGYTAERSFEFETEYGSDAVLLRADRAAYVVGETMQLTALTPVQFGSIYLDIVKEGQTLSTRSEPVSDGRAEFAVDLGPDLYGTLELHAYKVLADGSIVRDSRVVVVDEPRDLAIDIAADQDTYRPGDPATIRFRTSDQASGEPVGTALGVSIVDESVYALQQQDPGFAKLYFLLEAELMEPFYQINGFELPAAYTPDEQPLRLAQDTSARAAWADAPTFGLAAQTNSRPEKMAALRDRQQDLYQQVGATTLVIMALIPLLLWLTVVLALRGSGLTKRSLKGLGWSILTLVGGGIFFIVSMLFAAFVYENIIDFFGWWSVSAGVAIALMVALGLGGLVLAGILWGLKAARWQIGGAGLFGLAVLLWGILDPDPFNWYLYPDEFFPLLLAGLFGLAVLGLAIYAWRRRDEAAKFIVLLSLAWVGLLIVLILAADEGGEPSEGLVIVTGVIALTAPLTYLLYGRKLWAQGKGGAGWLASMMGGVAFLPALIIPLVLASTMNGGMLGGGPMMVEEMAMPAAAPLMALDEGMAERQAVAESAAGEMATGDDGATASPSEAPRLRQFFPETLYWNPEVLTDAAGQAQIELPVADSITTWRLTALASSQDGRLGFATQGMRVFQDFFVDIDLPVALTQGDEISIPVGIFNYLPEAQEVRLEVERAGWFELLGPAEQTVTIASNEVDVVYFPIRVVDFGERGFQVTAWGEQMSDAIRRPVRVLPDGQAVRLSESNWLREDLELDLDFPPDVVPRTPYVEVKIYTGVLAQVVEGLEKILRLPHG